MYTWLERHRERDALRWLRRVVTADHPGQFGQALMSPKTLLSGGSVLTLGAKTPNFDAADVLIEDGRIVEVGPGIRARDAEVVDARDTIVMPGFVDTHRHTWKSLFRNMGAGDHNPAAGDLGRHYRPDDIYAGTLIGLLGAAESGTTTVVDWADIPTGPDYLDAALQAHADAGLRTIFVHAITGADNIKDVRTNLQGLATARATSGLVTFALGSSHPIGTNLDQVGAEWSMAREIGLPIHAHAGTSPGARGAVAGLGGRDLLGNDVTLIHCSDLNDADLDAIASAGASVVLTPSTEMAGQLGSPPIQQLLDREIRIGLGVDDEQLAPGDLFAQMRATISVQHATYFDLKLAGKAGLPNLLTTRDVIRYATTDGARAVGLDATTGSIVPGKQADLIVLRTDRPNIYPINDPIGAVVWGMDTSNLDWVFVAGRAIMRDGTLQADVERARSLASDAHRRVGMAAGLPASLAAGQ